MKFEFTVDGTPVSQQTRRRERLRIWKMLVRQEAEKYWSSDQTMTNGAVMLQITYFYNAVAMDVDNIVKPIQDAIIGLVYFDDNQVTDILVRKRYLLTKFKTMGITATLQEGFDRRNEFLSLYLMLLIKR